MTIILCSCKNEKKDKGQNIKTQTEKIQIPQKNITPDSEFGKYISSLDNIPLPLKHNPLGRFPYLSKKYDKTEFEKFKHTWTSQPLGILYKDKNSIGM